MVEPLAPAGGCLGGCEPFRHVTCLGGAVLQGQGLRVLGQHPVQPGLSPLKGMSS